MPRYVCDFKGVIEKAQNWDCAMVSLGCISCISENYMPCGGPTRLLDGIKTEDLACEQQKIS